MERNKLISLALSFSSFIVSRIEINSIILFGSVAKNTFDKESDIDLFIETNEKNADKINSLLDLYKKTEEYGKFKIEGIKNDISIKIGKLKKWKDLKRSIISGGIILYGGYQGKPDNLSHKLLFSINLENLKRAEKIKIWRKVYGYQQKAGNKVYSFKGIAERKIGKGAFLIPIEKLQEIKDYFIKNKIKHSFFDVWMES